MICCLEFGILMIERRWQSGQLHQTVNLAPSGYGGSNPSLRKKFDLKLYICYYCGSFGNSNHTIF